MSTAIPANQNRKRMERETAREIWKECSYHHWFLRASDSPSEG